MKLSPVVPLRKAMKMDIRLLREEDLIHLDNLIDGLGVYHSPLRHLADREARSHRKLSLRQVSGESPSSEPGIFVAARNGRIRGFFSLFTDIVDTLYCPDQGTVLDMCAGDCDLEALNEMLAGAEDIVRSIPRQYLAVNTYARDREKLSLLQDRGFLREYTLFVREIPPHGSTPVKIPCILREARYSDAKMMLEMGAAHVKEVLSLLRFNTEDDMRNEYMRGRAFDWWYYRDNFPSFLVVNGESSEVRGFVTLELDRIDYLTGTGEAHLVDIVFRDSSTRDRLLSPVLGAIDGYLRSRDYSLLVWKMPSSDRETTLLLEAVDPSAEEERLVMVRKICDYADAAVQKR